MYFYFLSLWRNWTARETSNLKVVGSSPTRDYWMQSILLAFLAQSVERRPFKPVVVGSSPTEGV